jgi:hypothetical protein
VQKGKPEGTTTGHHRGLKDRDYGCQTWCHGRRRWRDHAGEGTWDEVKHMAKTMGLVLLGMVIASGARADATVKVVVDRGVLVRCENLLTKDSWGAAPSAASRRELSGTLRYDNGQRLVEGAPSLEVHADGPDLVLTARGAAEKPGVYGTRWAITGLKAADVQILLPAAGVGAAFTAERGGDADFDYAQWEGWEMQLAILQGKRGGLMVWSEDARGMAKAVHVRRIGDTFSIAFDSHEQAPFTERREATSVAWHIAAYKGDWRAPAARYRAWMMKTWRPAGYVAPAWVNDIGLVVNFAPHTTAAETMPILEALAKVTLPQATLINVPNWRTDGFDTNYPNYVGAPGFDKFVARAHELGFRVMPYTNMFGCDVRNPLYESLKQNQMRDGFTGALLGWYWTEPANPNRFAYINHGNSAFRTELVKRLKAVREQFGVDAIHVDQSVMLFNDGQGLVEGMTHGEGRLKLHQELAAAMPGVAFAGEEISEMNCGVQNFAQRFPPAPTEAYRPHPLLAYLYAPFTRMARHYNCTPHSTITPGELATALARDAQYGMIPTIWADGVRDLDAPGIKALLQVARFHQERGLRSDDAPWPADTIHAFRTADGRQVCVRRTAIGQVLADGAKVAYELISGVERVERAGSVAGHIAYDEKAIFGLDPSVAHLFSPEPRDMKAPHIEYLSENVIVGEAAAEDEWLTATFVDAPTKKCACDFVGSFSKARLGIIYEDSRDAPIEYGAYFMAGASTCGGVTRKALRSNPPWNGNPTWGSPFAEFDVALPATKEPLTLRFAYGREDDSQQSDGISFRVLVDGKEIFRQHTAEKKWHEASADLTPYAGQKVRIRLLSDIGPAHNCSWDFAGWADPVVRVGTSEVEIGVAMRGGVAGAYNNKAAPLRPGPKGRYVVAAPARVTFVSQAAEVALPADLMNLPYKAYLRTALSMAPGSEYGSGTKSELDINGDKRSVILGHPPMYGRTVLRYHVALPARAAKLVFATTLRYTQPADGDGLRFLVVCNGKESWSRESRTAGWVEASVSLAEFAGQTVLLDLVTDSITKNWHDHCGWAGMSLRAE